MPFPFDKAGGFVARHRLALAATGAGLVGAAGAAYGIHRGTNDAAGQDTLGQANTIAHHGVAAGLSTMALGIPLAAAGYAGRSMFGAAKHTASWYGKGLGAAFNERTVKGVLSHGPVGLTLGGLAGGALAGAFSDDPSSIATGVGVGMAAGVMGLPLASRVASDWQRLGNGAMGKLAKTGVLAGAAVGVGLLARAYLHAPEYEAEDAGVRDGLGAYEAVPSGLRERLTAMNGSGDIVLGLHNQRH